MDSDELTCSGCGDGFTPKRYNQRFCTPKCQKRLANRKLSDGSAAIMLVLAAADTRHAPRGSSDAEVSRYARRELARLAAILGRRDKQKRRAVRYVADMLANDETVLDRISEER